MFIPFRLKQPIGEAYNMDLDDSLNTKKTLAELGHMKLPAHGLTEYPDRPMIDGVKSFQREQGLAVDGVMKPDGPTIQRLNETLRTKPRRSDSAPAAPSPRVSLPTPVANAARAVNVTGRAPGTPPAAKPGSATPPHKTEAQPNSLFQPVRLTRPVGPTTDMDLEDARKVKTALNDLGLLHNRGRGLTPYADQPMTDAVEAFQRQQGLTVDGVMNPGGETERRMNVVRAEKAAEEAVRKDHETGEAAGTQVAFTPLAAAAGNVIIRSILQNTFRNAGSAALGQTARKAASAAGAGTAGAIANEELKESDKAGTAARAPLENPPPPLPGFEAPDDEWPHHTESPAQPVEVLDLSQPIPKLDEPTILITPIPEPGEFGDGIVERKGNEATRKELEKFRDYFRSKGWTHIAGGRFAADDPWVINKIKNAKAGGERPEFHVKGHFGGLKGGRFTDLTFQDENGRIIHIQSVDVDKNGKPTQRELDAAEAIRRATGDSVLLIPKGIQLERLKKRPRNR